MNPDPIPLRTSLFLQHLHVDFPTIAACTHNAHTHTHTHTEREREREREKEVDTYGHAHDEATAAVMVEKVGSGDKDESVGGTWG